MIIAQISDTHVSVDLPQGVRRLSDLRRAVAAVNALDPQPDVVIHTGDLANRGRPQEYAEAKKVLDGLRAPFYPVPGNRDHRDPFRERFVHWPCLADGEPFVQYAVEGHAVRLLGLDSQCADSNKGDFCEARAAALARALNAQPDRPTAIFMHHPPYEVAGDPESFQFETREGAARVRATLRSAGRVIRLFCGHAHRSRQVDLDGLVASTVASIAVDLRQGDDPQREAGAPRFHVHRYDPVRGFTTVSVEAA